MMCHKIVCQDETEHCTEAFDPDDTTLVDRYPTYQPYTEFSDLPPKPTQQCQQHYKGRARRKQAAH
jgi:hypothetical protein